jgi:hypothetical protein
MFGKNDRLSDEHETTVFLDPTETVIAMKEDIFLFAPPGLKVSDL